jgi:hypothetical protein
MRKYRHSAAQIYKGIMARCGRMKGYEDVELRVDKETFVKMWSKARVCAFCGGSFIKENKSVHRRNCAKHYTINSLQFVHERCHRKWHGNKRSEMARNKR